jgi:hypothetical protein
MAKLNVLFGIDTPKRCQLHEGLILKDFKNDRKEKLSEFVQGSYEFGHF